MKFSKILFCYAVLFFATATQAAEKSPPTADCSELAGHEASMCKIHNTAHANCVEKGVSTMELFAACIKDEVEDILSKRAHKARTVKVEQYKNVIILVPK